MNDLTILEFSIDKSNQTYVTEEALSYFDSIEHDLYQIANDIYKMQKGKDLSLTPDTAGEAMRIMDKIDELREVMRHCNHNNSQNAKCVIGVKDILIKFKYIKALMLNGEEETRNDGVMLFTKTAFLYSAEEQKEFVDMLNADELNYVMQIAKQERTVIDKVVTNSKMFEFAKAKMKQLGDELDNYICF